MQPSGPNAEQIEYWNVQAAPTWLAENARLDAMLAPLGLAAMERARPAAGERVLDVGCGVGQTSLQLASRVGPSGSVLGVDISAPMLERARARASAEKLANVRFENADAQTCAFTPDSVDLIFSRFGVMFFADPDAAFANLHRALQRNGRLAFVCWQALAQNPWMSEAIAAIAKHMQLPAPAAPDAPGPLAFADAARVRGILERAGFRGVSHEPLVGEIALGRTVDEALDFSTQVGPASRALREATEAQRAAARASIRESLAARLTSAGVRMGYGAWIVSAER
ncbi:MAG: class I SAM-dependent methyltransferase [Myxococcota bacterium]